MPIDWGAAVLGDHERIWLGPRCQELDGGEDGRQWCQDNVWDSGCQDCGLPAVEYVRADLASRPSAAVLDLLREARPFVAMECDELPVQYAEDARRLLAAIDALLREEGK